MIEATICLLVRGDPPTHILLGLKKTGFGAGKYAGFGGKVRPGEANRAAAVRELVEETGIRADPADLLRVGEFEFLFPARPAWSQVVHLFLGRVWQGEPAETLEMLPAWFSVDQIPYEAMWQDNAYWLPRVLAGERVRARFTFAADNETVASIETAAWDTEPDRPGPSLSRRTFVGLMAAALGGLVSACRPSPAPQGTQASVPVPTQALNTAVAVEGPTSTASPSPTATRVPPIATQTPTTVPSPAPNAQPMASPAPTSTLLPPTYTPVPATATIPPLPTATPQVVPGRAVLMAHWPAAAASRVVLVRHSGVWAGDLPDAAIVLQMLDDGLRALTGVADAPAIWRALFDAGERVLLKVNCIAYGGPTQPAVAYAVAQRLQDAGLAPQNILIFDRTDNELAAAGYGLNEGEAGLQCHGSRGEGTEITLSQARVRFYREIDACDAIVNIPTPKQHSGAGISMALKNHYGSINRPGSLHGNWCDPAIAELNAQPLVRDKTRLIVGAALNVSPCDWNRPERDSALLLSFDPVALDTAARDILVSHRQALGLDSGFLVEGARHLRTAQSLGLGATDSAAIDLREVILG